MKFIVEGKVIEVSENDLLKIPYFKGLRLSGMKDSDLEEVVFDDIGYLAMKTYLNIGDISYYPCKLIAELGSIALRFGDAEIQEKIEKLLLLHLEPASVLFILNYAIDVPAFLDICIPSIFSGNYLNVIPEYPKEVIEVMVRSNYHPIIKIRYLLRWYVFHQNEKDFIIQTLSTIQYKQPNIQFEIYDGTNPLQDLDKIIRTKSTINDKQIIIDGVRGQVFEDYTYHCKQIIDQLASDLKLINHEECFVMATDDIFSYLSKGIVRMFNSSLITHVGQLYFEGSSMNYYPHSGQFFGMTKGGPICLLYIHSVEVYSSKGNKYKVLVNDDVMKTILNVIVEYNKFIGNQKHRVNDNYTSTIPFLDSNLVEFTLNTNRCFLISELTHISTLNTIVDNVKSFKEMYVYFQGEFKNKSHTELTIQISSAIYN